MVEFTIDEIKKEPQTFMMSASWCPPCQQLKKMYKFVPVPYVNMDDDTDNVEEFCNDNNLMIRAFPTLIEYKNGKFVISNIDPGRYLINKKKEMLADDYIDFDERIDFER